MQAEAKAAVNGPRDGLDRLKAIGPGLVMVLAGLGPRDILTNSIAGSTAGYSLMWTLVVALVIRVIMHDASGRYTLVKGESVLAGTGNLSRWSVLVWLGATILRRHVGALVNITLLGTAANLVFPLPTRYSIAIWGIISWCSGFAFLYWGRYRVIEKLSRPLTVAMGLCVVVATVLARPNVLEIFSGAIHPALPPQDGIYHPALIVLAVLASTMGSSSSLKYSSYVYEKGWRDIGQLRRQRTDLFVSIGGMFFVLFLMQIVAAATLHPLKVQVRELEDLVPIFGQTMGTAGVLVFGILLWCITFSVYIGNAAGYGIMVSDVYNRFVRPSVEVVKHGKAAGQMPAYRWLVIYTFLSPLYVVFTGWKLVPIVLVGSVLSILVVPIVAVVTLRLTADRKIMGEYVNGWFTNAVLVLAIICSIYLTWEAGSGLLANF